MNMDDDWRYPHFRKPPISRTFFENTGWGKLQIASQVEVWLWLNSMVYGRSRTSWWGLMEPTYDWGAPSWYVSKKSWLHYWCYWKEKHMTFSQFGAPYSQTNPYLKPSKSAEIMHVLHVYITYTNDSHVGCISFSNAPLLEEPCQIPHDPWCSRPWRVHPGSGPSPKISDQLKSSLKIRVGTWDTWAHAKVDSPMICQYDSIHHAVVSGQNIWIISLEIIQTCHFEVAPLMETPIFPLSTTIFSLLAIRFPLIPLVVSHSWKPASNVSWSHQ